MVVKQITKANSAFFWLESTKQIQFFFFQKYWI